CVRPAFGRDRLHALLEVGQKIRAAGHTDDGRALSREITGHPPPDAGRCTGDDRDRSVVALHGSSSSISNLKPYAVIESVAAVATAAAIMPTVLPVRRRMATSAAGVGAGAGGGGDPLRAREAPQVVRHSGRTWLGLLSADPG